eukprot:GFYU01001629.1.p1 GENE.GFYU01001629.1~~GFYU01001629.1.p1  ORF type:complete len:1046 (-),score=368.07 GFYU01001629.1:102-3239(-)
MARARSDSDDSRSPSESSRDSETPRSTDIESSREESEKRPGMIHLHEGEHGSFAIYHENVSKYVAWSAKRPCSVCWGALLIPIVMAIVVFGGGFFEFSEDSGSEWDIVNSIQVEQLDALEDARKFVFGSGTTGSLKERELENENTFNFVFRDDGDNLFTAQKIAKIREIQNIFAARAEYATDLCQLQYNGNTATGCRLALAITNEFYPHVDGQTIIYNGNGTTQADLTTTLNRLSADRFKYAYYFDKSFSATNQKSKYTRSTFFMGLPLKGFTSTDSEEQDEKMEKFMEDIEKDLIEYFDLKAPFLGTVYLDQATTDGMEVVWWTDYFQNFEFVRVTSNDFLWAIASGLFIWLYMWFHTSSFFLASVGIGNILLSFPFCFFWGRVVFGVTYFSQLNIMAVFVILGIGADDLFVFIDAYQQAKVEPPEISQNLVHRVDYMYRRAVKATFVTSATTTLAFLATAISDIMPISSFGIFASFMVVGVYILSITVIPPAVVWWARTLEGTGCCCRGKRAADMSADKSADAQPQVKPQNEDTGVKMVKVDPQRTDSSYETASESDIEGRGGGVQPQVRRGESHNGSFKSPVSPTREQIKAQLRRTEVFYNGVFNDFIQGPARFAILIAFAALLATAIYYVSLLRPPQKQEMFFPDNHMIAKFVNWQDEFGSSADDEVVKTQITWGISRMNRDGIDRWDSRDRGKVEWDNSFDLTDPAAQTYILNVCAAAKTASCSADGCIGGTLVNKGNTDCFIDGFKTWMEANYPAEGFPAPQNVALARFTEFSALDSTLRDYKQQIGVRSGRIYFASVEFDSTLRRGEGGDIRFPVWEAWRDFISAQEGNAPNTAKNAFATNGRPWTWMMTERALVANSLFGIGICTAMAFVTLCLSTQNVLIAFYAICTILGILATVMGIFVKAIAGMDFGISESISAIIMIGFSVDYVVHLGNAYVESSNESRYYRVQDALTAMGVSVTAGALTTLGSGCFLWGATLTFFTKFAFLISTTIAMSFIWSVFFFMALCATVGPSGEFCNIGPWIKQARAKWDEMRANRA